MPITQQGHKEEDCCLEGYRSIPFSRLRKKIYTCVCIYVCIHTYMYVYVFRND